MAHIRRRTFAVDDFDRQRGQFTGHVYDQFIVRALRSLQDFATSAECRALRSARSSGQVLGRLDCLFAQAPGMDWHHDLEVSTFGAEWALVLAYDDAEDRQEAAFPSILGFAARADFPWSVAAVLSRDVHGTPPPTLVEASGWSDFDESLFTFCWSRGDDGVGLGRYLLELDREDIEAFLDECDGLSYETILERIASASDEDADVDNFDERTQSNNPDRDLFQQLAEVIGRGDRVDREEEQKTRIPRLVAWLAAKGSETDSAPDVMTLQAAAAEFGGLSAADTRNILLQAVRHSESAARAVVALARLRLSLREEEEYAKPHSSVTALHYGMAVGARNIVRRALSEQDAREIIAHPSADRSDAMLRSIKTGL